MVSFPNVPVQLDHQTSRFRLGPENQAFANSVDLSCLDHTVIEAVNVAPELLTILGIKSHSLFGGDTYYWATFDGKEATVREYSIDREGCNGVFNFLSLGLFKAREEGEERYHKKKRVIRKANTAKADEMAKDFPILRVGLAQAEQDLGHQLEVIDYGGGRRDMLLGDDSNLALFASLAGADAVIEYHNPPIQSYMVIGSHAAGTPVRFKDSSSSCNTSFKDYTGLEAALRDQGFLNN